MEKIVLGFIQAAVALIGAMILAAIMSLITGGIFFVLWGYLAPKYFTFLSPVYLHISYWDSVVIAYFLTFIGDLIFKKE